LLARQQQMRAAVADNDARPRVGGSLMVFHIEIAGGFDDFGGNLENVSALDRMR
jgi:hypothetical protein